MTCPADIPLIWIGDHTGASSARSCVEGLGATVLHSGLLHVAPPMPAPILAPPILAHKGELHLLLCVATSLSFCHTRACPATSPLQWSPFGGSAPMLQGCTLGLLHVQLGVELESAALALCTAGPTWLHPSFQPANFVSIVASCAFATLLLLCAVSSWRALRGPSQPFPHPLLSSQQPLARPQMQPRQWPADPLL